jgi:hypothetical protein
MDIASKVKLLRNGVKRFNEAQLKVMKRQTGNTVVKLVKMKARQAEAVKVNDKILEVMDAIKMYVQIGGKEREYENSIRDKWEGFGGNPGIEELVKEHGELNGYDEEDIEERKEELFQEIEDEYVRFYGR